MLKLEIINYTQLTVDTYFEHRCVQTSHCNIQSNGFKILRFPCIVVLCTVKISHKLIEFEARFLVECYIPQLIFIFAITFYRHGPENSISFSHSNTFSFRHLFQ